MFESNRRSFLRALGVGAAVAVPTTAIAMRAEPGDADDTNTTNPFHVPPGIIPPGMKYEWKRIFIDPNTPDAHHLANMLKLGWQPVPFARHEKYFPHRGFHSWIEVGGLVLMEKEKFPDAAVERMRHEDMLEDIRIDAARRRRIRSSRGI